MLYTPIESQFCGFLFVGLVLDSEKIYDLKSTILELIVLAY